MLQTKHCQCLRSSVKASVLEIYKNLLNSKNSRLFLGSYSKTKQFGELQNHIMSKVSVDSSEDDSEDEATKKGVKTVFTKKIKKEKKPVKKILYNNEEFVVDYWIEC